MALDRAFIDRNRAATNRIRSLAESLSDDELSRPIGHHWTIGATFAHISFWDGRVLVLLDSLERDGKVPTYSIDTVVNDIALPLWLAVPPREAARIAISTAEKLDQRLENLPPELLDQVAAHNMRFVERTLHRGEHLDEVDRALKG